MLDIPTVFVLGAGASIPYGYPSGETLIGWLTASQQGDSTISEADFDRLRQALLRSPDKSVDAFLERQPRDLQDIGKRAIAESLIRCEDPKKLFRQSASDADDWIRFLLSELLADVHFERLFDLPLAFVTFNYDRSLEAVLMDCLTSKYKREVEQVGPLLKERLPIVHVHGDLGPLDWQHRDNVESRAYSSELTPQIVDRAASQIKIIHEADPSDIAFKNARQLLGNSKRIYFLGFGYLPLNLKRLGIPFGQMGETQCHGSAFKLSEARRGAFTAKYVGLNLGKEHHRSVVFLDNCRRFLDDAG